VRLVVLADTHLRSGDLGPLGPRVLQAVEGSDAVLHAGDVVSPAALRALRALAGPRPFHAVRGNNDLELTGALPDSVVMTLGGVEVAVVHDAGRRQGRAARLHRAFPTAALVVFGHSHVPVDEAGLAGQVLFNPGSPTRPRAQPHPTIGVVEVGAKKLGRCEIVPV
jgi:putative phosphoesterase